MVCTVHNASSKSTTSKLLEAVQTINEYGTTTTQSLWNDASTVFQSEQDVAVDETDDASEEVPEVAAESYRESRTPDDVLDINIDGEKVLNVVRDEYVSYTIDTSSDRAFFTTDFTDSQLIYLAEQLAPAIVRVGGTGNDWLVYQMGSRAEDCQQGTATNDKGFKRECLTGEKWDSLVNFIGKAKGKIMFGLNMLYPYLPLITEEDPLGDIPWNSTNAADLFDHIIANNQSVWGLELGNEQNRRHTGHETGLYYQALHNLLVSKYPNEVDRPRLAGPAPHSFFVSKKGWDEDKAEEFTRGFLKEAGHLLTAFTYHEYVGVSTDKTAADSDMLDRAWTNTLRLRKELVRYGSKSGNAIELWAGEIANHNKGGRGWGNTFGTSLWYADSLAVKAARHHTLYCRQDLVGASYGLLEEESHAPQPSYWTAVLMKRLLGRKVLRVSSPVSNMRTYAFCSRGHATSGGVTLMLINIDREKSYGISPTLQHYGSLNQRADRYEYHLSAPNLNSTSIQLNGVELKLSSDGRLPNLDGRYTRRSEDASTIYVEPLSYVMVAYPDARVPACTETEV